MGRLAVWEFASGLLTVLAAFWTEVKHVSGLVFWIATLYANIWGAALAVLALPSWIGLGVLTFQVRDCVCLLWLCVCAAVHAAVHANCRPAIHVGLPQTAR